MIVKGYLASIGPSEARVLASKGVFVFNSMCVGGREHLIYSYEKAKKAFDEGRNIANNFHIEIMLILSGRRQIKDAIELCGVRGDMKIAAISEMSFVLPYKRDDSVLECDGEKLKYLGLDKYGSSCDLFFENSALLELLRSSRTSSPDPF